MPVGTNAQGNGSTVPVESPTQSTETPAASTLQNTTKLLLRRLLDFSNSLFVYSTRLSANFGLLN
jgi:hypothetical protein